MILMIFHDFSAVFFEILWGYPPIDLRVREGRFLVGILKDSCDFDDFC